MSRKQKHLSHLIQVYAGRISSQVEQQRSLISTVTPARSVETASNVTIVPPLPFHAKLPFNLFTLNMRLQDLDVCVLVDMNIYMEGSESLQRFVLVHTHVVIVALICDQS